MRSWTLATMLTLLGGTAQATDGLAWQWDGASHRYLLRADLDLADVMWVKAKVNRDARVTAFSVDVVTTCTPVHARGRRAWALSCTLDDLSVRFESLPSEPGLLGDLAVELDNTYTGAVLTLTMRDDGRVRGVDLAGVDEFSRTIKRFHEDFRQMLLRAFAPLELRLPEHGSDRGTGRYEAVGTLAMGLPSKYGTVGRATVTYSVGDRDGDLLSLTTSGEGVVGTGEVVMIGGSERMRDPYHMTLAGTATFDVARGLLVEQAYRTDATLSASSLAAESTPRPYVQRSQARLLADDLTVELPASGERTADAVR